ncbi:hypothetical protein [Aquirufa sp.]|uniref:hypothetical protein n=1 Tax=Aquirufa sp. TaxID=2676249 RepID=UPI003782F2D3
MKSIRLKYCTDNGCTFKFVSRASVRELSLREDKGVVSLNLFLKTGEEIALSGYAESIDSLNKRWLRFEDSDEIFFDLAEFEVKK